MKGFTSAGSINATDFYQFYYCKRKILIERVYGAKRIVRDKMVQGKEEHEKERKRLLERTEVYGIRKDVVKEILEGFCMSHGNISGCPDIIVMRADGSVVIVELKLTDYPGDNFARKAQVYVYAYLAIKHFLAERVSAYIYYIKQKRAERVSLPEDLEGFVMKTSAKIELLLAHEELPEAVMSERCNYCEFYRFCWG